MEMLQVRNGQIVTEPGAPIRLRGVCVGGWMNMEHFLNGYPGVEHTLRERMAEVLGEQTAEFFFDRFLDYMLAEEDIRFIKETGASVVRLPLNYRHFESDLAPFQYLEKGFQRLDQALEWCAQHKLYAILDLHAVQGWQNPDWHSDNDTRHPLFWRDRLYQDRFVALWEEFARRYSDQPAVAGYNLMNEPVTAAPQGPFEPYDRYQPDWPAMNRVYRRAVDAIRTIDPRHIIFLEGDLFSTRFSGLEAPFADNLVYSCHNYNSGGFVQAYPSEIEGVYWDYQQQVRDFEQHEGCQYMRAHNAPLWSGEFSAGYSPDPSVEAARARGVSDQIAVFEQNDVHWTTWAYKDIGKMSWLRVRDDCEYLDVIRPVLEAKRLLHTDFFDLEPSNPASEAIQKLARIMEETIGDPLIDPRANERFMAQHTLNNYVGTVLQRSYAACFRGMSEARIDEVLSAFALQKCVRREAFLDVIRKYTQQ